MKIKRERTVFICQITNSFFKAAKCLLRSNRKSEFTALEAQPLPPEASDEIIIKIIRSVFNKLGYAGNPVIISLPCNQATSRYLKVPAQENAEIEKISIFQASRYLPYPPNELITSFQIISTGKEGFSFISLTIAKKSAIFRYLNIFRQFQAVQINIVLSSNGLCKLLAYLKPAEPETLMIINVDSDEAEAAIISSNKLIFSRSFKIIKSNPDWVDSLISEVKKSRDVYLKEVSPGKMPVKIIALGADNVLDKFRERLEEEAALPVEKLAYLSRINFSKDLIKNGLNLENSFASLLGLGLNKIEDSLSLLPDEIKNAEKNKVLRKERMRVMLAITGTILFWHLGLLKDIDNKRNYLARLKTELARIENEAKPLAVIERKLALLDSYPRKKPAGFEFFYALQKVMPQGISLSSLIYETDNLIIFRGQAKELNTVFEFMSKLEKSTIFNEFSIRVKYATARIAKSGEILDFEIEGLKK